MDVTACIFLLSMINIVMHIALQGSIAARRVSVETTACLHGEVRRLLHGLHGEIFGRMDDHRPLATDPGNKRGPIFVIMAPPWFAFLTAPPRSPPQGLFPSVLGLPLVARGLVEVIGFHGACQLAVGFIGEGRIAQPPAPAIARTAMHPQLSRNTENEARQAQQKGASIQCMTERLLPSKSVP